MIADLLELHTSPSADTGQMQGRQCYCRTCARTACALRLLRLVSVSGRLLHLGPLGPLPLVVCAYQMRRCPAGLNVLRLREELGQKLLELQE